MKTSDNGYIIIMKFEGCRLAAYLDAVGVPTIGYGHTSGVKLGQKITQAQAVTYLKEDIVTFEANVNKYHNKYTWNQNEFDALVSFAFNNGSIDALTANGIRSRSVIAEKILLYNKGKINGVLKEIPGLTTRRKAERELFLSFCLDTKTGLEGVAGLSEIEIKANILIVQKWINQDYGDYLKKCKLTDCRLLSEDGKMGNKTRAALTLVLQIALYEMGSNLKIDGEYGENTNKAVKQYIIVKNGTKSVSSKVVQATLYCYGYNPQTFHNTFTPDCVTALKLCQSDYNLDVDGVAGVIFFATFLKQK